MLHSSFETFQNSFAPQFHHQQAELSEMPPIQMYNGQSEGAENRGRPYAPIKPSPDDYCRGPRRSDSAHSARLLLSTATATPQSPSIGASISLGASKGKNTPVLPANNMQTPTRSVYSRPSSIGDMHMPRQGSMEQAKRYRRRGLSRLNTNAQVSNVVLSTPFSNIATASTKRPSYKVGSPSSLSCQGSRASSSNIREQQGSAGSVSSRAPTRPPLSRQKAGTRRTSASSSPKPLIATPTPVRSIIAPLPLSNSILPTEPPCPAKKAMGAIPSSAMQEHTSLHEGGSGRGMKSRLRRDFSFGSAAESTELQKDKYQSEEDAELASIFTKQDVAGMGAGIHSAQTGFSGLMDNLSISPTASSASIMLRNMGNKLEKGGRFTKRLFKPKSVISVPAADGSIAEPTVGQVLVVSGEAGRQKVNVNTDPGNQVGGGTGYLKVERSSLHIRQTTARVGRSLGLTANESWPRKRIDGEYRERAEVFSLARKGILKRTGASSIQPPNETPKFSTPSSPNDDLARQVDINGEDCFGSTPQILITRTRSQNTPHGTLKNVTFSSLIQFYDAWSSSDYDRRGDVATCSRLTPMLAQQIKVELNSLKMEMEVHKLHKSHTYII